MSAEEKINGKFLVVILIVLITLKLCEVPPVAHWPWVWVFSPAWGPLLLVLMFVGGVLTMMFTVMAPIMIILVWFDQKRKNAPIVIEVEPGDSLSDNLKLNNNNNDLNERKKTK